MKLKQLATGCTVVLLVVVACILLINVMKWNWWWVLLPIIIPLCFQLFMIALSLITLAVDWFKKGPSEK